MKMLVLQFCTCIATDKMMYILLVTELWLEIFHGGCWLPFCRVMTFLAMMLLFTGNVLSQIGLSKPTPLSYKFAMAIKKSTLLFYPSTLTEDTWKGACRDFNYIFFGGARHLCSANLNIDGRAKLLDGNIRENWVSDGLPLEALLRPRLLVCRKTPFFKSTSIMSVSKIPSQILYHS